MRGVGGERRGHMMENEWVVVGEALSIVLWRLNLVANCLINRG